jgi:predicted outer membrane repeat protein
MVAVQTVTSWAQLVTACAASANITLGPRFKMGAYTNEIDFSGKVITIFGSNATLDAGQKGMFFNGDGSKGRTSLEIHGTTLKNGKASDSPYSGAINAYGGADVKIYDTAFISNQATNYGDGGAIYIESGDLEVYDSIFKSNTACMGGAIYTKSNATIYSCIFESNTAPGQGGAMYTQDSTLVIHDSTFDTNTAGSGNVGGAIYISIFTAESKLVNCTFTNNYCRKGGAVYVDNFGGCTSGECSNVTVVGCKFLGNNNTKGNNDVTRSDDLSNVTFACANGTVGAPVTMKAGESEIANPPPTSLKCTALKYSCDGLTGTCKQDQSGHFPTKSACSGVCTAQPTPAPCQVPRNCGDKNGTTVCGHTFTGCEFTCPFCCTPLYIVACDSCTEYKCKPVPPLPPPVTTKYSCVTMPNYHCVESSSGFYPLAKDCENACPPPSLSP